MEGKKIQIDSVSPPHVGTEWKRTDSWSSSNRSNSGLNLRTLQHQPASASALGRGLGPRIRVGVELRLTLTPALPLAHLPGCDCHRLAVTERAWVRAAGGPA